MTEARGKRWSEYSLKAESGQAFDSGMTEYEVLTLVQSSYREYVARKLHNHPARKNRESLYLDAYKVRRKKYRYVPFST